MDSNENLEVEELKVKINRGDVDKGDESVTLEFTDLKTTVVLSDDSIQDIKNLFDKIFEYITEKKCLLEFVLDDATNDLFNHVSQDIIDQLNAEIKESEDDFVNVWGLVT